jgi:hydrogenase maturation protease
MVLALGNPLLGDEGVGSRVLSRLSTAYRFTPSVELLDGGTAGLSLAPAVSDAGKVIVLDAVRTGRPPGTVVKLDGSKLPRRFFQSLSPHQVGFRDLVSATRLMSSKTLTGHEIVLIGAEPKTVAVTTELSAEVERAVEKVVVKVLRQLEAWGVVAERADATAACPSARPPSFGGTAL